MDKKSDYTRAVEPSGSNPIVGLGATKNDGQLGERPVSVA